MTRLISILLFSIINSLICASFAHSQNIPTSPGTDFDIGSLITNYKAAGGGSLYLSALDENLMGENYDVDTGSVSFNHTDVALPGNNSLPVTFSRRADGNYHLVYGEDHISEIGKAWKVDIPYVVTRVEQGNSLSCVDTLDVSDRFVNSFFTESLDIGTKLYTPGSGERDLGEEAVQTPAGFYGARKMATRDYWIATCGDATNLTGVTGYTVKAPNGNSYKFNHVKIRPSTFIVQFPPQTSIPPQVVVDNTYFMPTEITDVDGNWVKYSYNSHGVTRIWSNDGRDITINYTGHLVSSVVANGRQWTYAYNGDDLSRVTLPDGRYWSFGANEVGLGYTGVRDGDCVTKRIYPSADRDHVMRHPSGTVATFVTAMTFNHVTRVPAKPYTAWTSTGGGLGSFETSCSTAKVRPNMFMTRALQSKTLTLTDGEEYIWSYDYHLPAGAWGQACASRQSGYCVRYTKYFWSLQNSPTASDDVKKRTITDPLGHRTKFHINVNWVKEAQGILKVGALVKKERFEDSTSSIPLETTTFVDFEHVQIQAGAATFGNKIINSDSYFLPSVKTVERDGDTFTTEYQYNMDSTAADFAFTKPIEVKSYSNVSTTPRISETDFQNDRPNWILWQTDKVYQDSLELADYDYGTSGNAIGKLTSIKKLGLPYATFQYHSDSNYKGALFSVKDALDREIQLSDWKRGTPQLITLADNSTRSKTVDDNGWTTSATDGRGFITSFQHDDMGRVARIIPSKTQKNWDDTVITYDFTGGGAVQTVAKGGSMATTTYDSMYRKILEKTEDTTTGWYSYANTSYDAFGRAIFSSQPSDIEAEAAGTISTYDALGRLLTQDDNTTVDVIDLTNEYLSGHAARVTDAEGEQTTTYKNGFDEVIKIEQPDDTTTTITRNEWGQITEVSQGGNHNGFNVDEVQKYEYDAQQRLCRHHTPSGGSDLFEYTPAGELFRSSRGHDYASGCAAPSGDSLTEYSYDDMGRLEFTKYFDELTPFTRREYDDNGNLTLLYRYPHNLDEDPLWENDWRSTSWRYEYNELDMLENETLKIVRRTFDLDYDYNTDGSLKESTRSYRHDSWPAGDIYSYDFEYGRDGLGRATGVSMDGTTITSGAQYYPSGAMELMAYGNGLEFRQDLDNRLMPERLEVLGGAGSSIGHALDLNYTYTPRGMVAAMNDNVDITNSRLYGYDAQGRLETASGPWGSGSFTYDSVGNIRAKTLGTRFITLDYSEHRNRVTKSTDSGETGVRNITYDNRGNVEYLGEQRFLYTATDRPRVRRSTGAGNGFGKYRYDGHGRRVSAWEREDGEWVYRYNAYDASGALVFIVEEENQFPYNDTITHYVKQDGKTVARVKSTSLDATPEITWLHHDHLGSAVAGTKADGTTAWTEKYTPYGISMVNAADNDNQAGFTGHIKDSDTGLTYMQARYYDPVIGRFLSHDPVTFMSSSGDPSYFNRYSYAFNNSVNLVDPNGMYACFVDDCEQVDKIYDTLVEFRDKAKEGSEEREILDGVLTVLGKKGEAGPLIEIDNKLSAGGIYRQESDTIKINVEARRLKKTGEIFYNGLAATLAHEGAHAKYVRDYGPIKTLQDREATERVGYGAQNAVFSIMLGRGYVRPNIENQIKNSVVSACAKAPKGDPSCS